MRRMSPPDELPTSLWMVPYADLMSNMVILFLALFAYTYMNRTPEVEQAVAKLEEEMSTETTKAAKQAKVLEAETAVEIQTLLDGLALSEFGVKVTEKHIHLTLPTPVLFDLGSDRLSKESTKLLAPLAEILAKTNSSILVRGHTDDVPIVGGRHKTNWELSAARAFSVIRFLEESGLHPERFHARGYGEHRPAVANTDEASRARNRRIEISIVREAA